MNPSPQKNLFLFLFIIITLITLSSQKSPNEVEEEDTDLLFVWEHARHGARGPYIKVDPKTGLDMMGEKWVGSGEITSVGMRANYLLGVSTKKKYSSFLSSQFNPNEILIISTEVNRTLVSAYSNLQGMFNSSTAPKLTPTQISRATSLNTNYTTEINRKKSQIQNDMVQGGIDLFPVHIFNKKAYQFGLYDESVCPGVSKYNEENKKSKKVVALFEEISKVTNDTYGKEIFKFLDISGVDKPNYLWNISNLFPICDTFIADYTDGREMKNIRETGIDMEAFYQHSLNISFLYTYFNKFGSNPSSETVYITVSPIFRNLLNYMEHRILLDKGGKAEKVVTSSPKFVLLTGHDTSLAPVDIFMEDVFGVKFAMETYCTTQFFELRKEKGSGKYLVDFIVNQKRKARFDYEEFRKKVEKNIYGEDEIKEICKGTSSALYYLKMVFFILLFLVCISVMVLMCIIMKGKDKDPSMINWNSQRFSVKN